METQHDTTYSLTMKRIDKEGSWTVYYDSSNTRQAYKCMIINKTLNGKETSWYRNGNKRFEKNYSNGILNGSSNEWFNNGNKKLELNYTKGKPNGELTSYHDDGKISGKSYYKEDMPIGHWTGWYPNGQKYSETIFDQWGRKDSVETIWYDNGEIMESHLYLYGDDRHALLYYPDGKLSFEFDNLTDPSIEKKKYYDPRGNAISIEEWYTLNPDDEQ